MIVNMIVFQDKGYRIFYSTELGHYVMGCISSKETIAEEFFMLAPNEYDEWNCNVVHLNSLASFFMFAGNFSSRFLKSDKRKVLKAELKAYVKKKSEFDSNPVRVLENSSMIADEEQTIRNDFRTVVLIAKLNSLAAKFRTGTIQFSEAEGLQEERLIYDDEDVMFDNGSLKYYRLIDEISEDAGGALWIESFYDETVFNGMQCFLSIDETRKQEIQIFMLNETDTITIKENGEWIIER